jgi:hypothetical protein
VAFPGGTSPKKPPRSTQHNLNTITLTCHVVARGAEMQRLRVCGYWPSVRLGQHDYAVQSKSVLADVEDEGQHACKLIVIGGSGIRRRADQSLTTLNIRCAIIKSLN